MSGPEDQIYDGNSEDIFEINDFTVVTEYERCIAQLELIIHEWNISGRRPSLLGHFEKNLKTTSKPLKFKDKEYTFTFHYVEDAPTAEGEFVDDEDEEKLLYLPTAAKDMLSPEFDLRSKDSIFSQFGVFEYILLEPCNHLVEGQDMCKDIQSLLNVAAMNSGCEIPMFFRIGGKSQNFYNGICMNQNARTTFEGIDTPEYLKKLGYFSGLIDMFKEKVECEVNDLPPIDAVVQFDYVYEPELSDTDNQSTDDELNLPPFTLNLDFGDNKSAVRLDSFIGWKMKLLIFLFLLSLFKDALADEDSPLIYQPLDVIDFEAKRKVNGKYPRACPGDSGGGTFGVDVAVSRYVLIGISSFTFGNCWDEDQAGSVKLCLSVLWPRLNDETVNETDNFTDLDPYTSPRWLIDVKFDGSRKILYSTMDELLDTKEMPSSERKVSHFAQVNPRESEMASALSMITRSHATDTADIGFIQSASLSETAQQFTKNAINTVFETPYEDELKFEDSGFQSKCQSELSRCKASPSNSLTLRISTALAKCLNSDNGLEKICNLWLEFVDKLSIKWDNTENILGLETNVTPDLACCLLHQKFQMLQFCIETKRKRHQFLDKMKDPTQAMCSSSSSSSDIFFDAEDETQGKQETKEQVPKGRLEALPEFLLERPDEEIYVPMTQDKGPMTDDMIEARTHYLASQTSSDRVKEQLDVLLSDMQAFKAANPGAEIEDFIYWHSPRDWSKTDEGKVELSERMRMSNNIWIDTWNNAKPIPVSSQSRLFNEAKEAHTILQFFQELTVRELIDLIQPSAFYNAGQLLIAKAKDAESLIADELLELCKFIAKSTRRAYSEDYFDACKKIDSIENKIFWIQSINEMLEKEIVIGGLEQIADKKLFKEFTLEIVQRKGPVRILDAPNGALAMCIRQLMNNATRFETMNEDANEEELRLPQPYRKHYLFRWLVQCPGLNSRKVPQRMYSCVGEKYFYVAGAFTEDATFM